MATSRSKPGCSTQWYRQRRLRASWTSRVRLLVRTTSGGVVGVERAELGDRDLPVRQHLEEVGLELVVGAVDLVDEQHRRRALARLDRLQQGPLHEEALLVQLGLEGVGRAAGRLARGLGGPQVEELAPVVPVVDGLGGVDALVALQPDQLAARPRRQHLGQLGLADAGLALQQQRPPQRDGQEHGGGQPLVRQVPVPGECRRRPRRRWSASVHEELMSATARVGAGPRAAIGPRRTGPRRGRASDQRRLANLGIDRVAERETHWVLAAPGREPRHATAAPTRTTPKQTHEPACQPSTNELLIALSDERLGLRAALLAGLLGDDLGRSRPTPWRCRSPAAGPASRRGRRRCLEA